VISLDRLVVDASVVVKWYLPEIGSTEASVIRDDQRPKLAPDLLVVEFGNVLWKKVRRGELEALEALEVANAFTSACPVILRPAIPFLPLALEIATRYQCTLYDALYLAVAVAEETIMLTADSHLVERFRDTKLDQTVQLLRPSPVA